MILSDAVCIEADGLAKGGTMAEAAAMSGRGSDGEDHARQTLAGTGRRELRTCRNGWALAKPIPVRDDRNIIRTDREADVAELKNITRFKMHSLKALGYLYENHPMPMELSARQVMSAEEAAAPPIKDFWGVEISDEAERATETILWLLDNGYIAGERLNTGVFGAKLRPRAWHVLDKPDPLEPSKSMGGRLVEFAKEGATSGSKAGAKSAATAAASHGLAAIATALGLG